MSNQVDTLNVKSPVIWTPETIDKAVELKEQLGLNAEFISGGTLLQLQWASGRKLPEHLISLEGILEMKSIKYDQKNAELSIGAITPLGAYQTNKILKEFPVFCEALKSIAAPGIRNRGTIGGNLMSGIGDLIPFFLSLNANLVFCNAGNFEQINIWDWVKQSAAKERLLSKILIPLDKDTMETYTFYRKIGRRETFTAAILTVSGKIKWNQSNNIAEAKLAIGGGDNKPVRLEKTEQYLLGKKGAELDWKNIYSIITDEFIALDDAFVTGSYRKKVAANLIVAELQGQFIQSGYREEQVYEI
ncbi:FAD binding domain-containing protein [Lysinibacillus fusiformis]|nr:FAD binding domain-containing protein [Lysinibacillus fusiformis]